MNDAAIKSARRVLEVLEYFDKARRPLGLTELCRRLGYPTSSGAEMLKSLVVLGYLQYDRESRTYLPTMRVALLGAWVPEQLLGPVNALPMMSFLRDRTRETIMLGAQSDLFAQYLHVVRSPQPLQYAVEAGAVRPLARCGLGRLLLSAQDDEAIDRLLRRINVAEADAAARVSMNILMDHIGRIRSDGHVFAPDLLIPGVGVIAMLLPERTHNRRLAVAVAGPSARLAERFEEHLGSLREAIRLYQVDTPERAA